MGWIFDNNKKIWFFKLGNSIRVATPAEKELNKNRQKILQKAGYKVKMDGSWGPYHQNLWDKHNSTTIAHEARQKAPDKRRVNISTITQKENRGRPIPVEALEQLQDSLINRNYPYPQRLAILASSLQEVNKDGAASIGEGGNGYLGLEKGRMPILFLDDTPEGRGKQIQYILEDIENIHPDNWSNGGDGFPKIDSARDGYNKFWTEKDPYQATLFLNKSYIRPRYRQNAWNNRAKITNILKTK